jgi:hypothetical protein
MSIWFRYVLAILIPKIIWFGTLFLHEVSNGRMPTLDVFWVFMCMGAACLVLFAPFFGLAAYALPPHADYRNWLLVWPLIGVGPLCVLLAYQTAMHGFGYGSFIAEVGFGFAVYGLARGVVFCLLDLVQWLSRAVSAARGAPVRAQM